VVGAPESSSLARHFYLEGSGRAPERHDASSCGRRHVHQAEILVPLFSGRPAVTAAVFSPQSPGEAFVMYNVEVNQFGQLTRIVFSSTSWSGWPG